LLEETALSQTEFTRLIDVSPMRISHVVRGASPVTAELALRFGRAFGQTPHYWLNLQSDYDLKTAQLTLDKAIAHIPALLAA
jgi:antitoxin HigA-1